MVRPEGLELSTFWFVAVGSKNPSCFFGVVYEPRARFFTLPIVRRLSVTFQMKEGQYGDGISEARFGEIEERLAIYFFGSARSFVVALSTVISSDVMCCVLSIISIRFWIISEATISGSSSCLDFFTRDASRS
jgi:hypothetical protein